MKKYIQSNSISFDFNDKDVFAEAIEPLKNIFKESQVVALGENSHFIKEFFVLRHRIIEFLVKECGFDILAFEFGFSEGFKIDGWMNDEEEGDIREFLTHFYYPKEFEDTLCWLRDYNKTASRKVEFFGIDVPRNGGSYFPSLKIVYDFIKMYDASSLFLVEKAVKLAERIDCFSAAQAAIALDKIDINDKNELSGLLSKILIRLEVMRPLIAQKVEEEHFETIIRHLKSIIYSDYNMQAMSGFIKGVGIEGDMGARDKFMVDSILRRLEKSPERKMILIAHNAHIQKTPVYYDEFLSCLPIGQRLARSLGDKFLSYALTCHSGFTAALYPDEREKFGFKVDNFKLDPSIPNSIEFELKNAGVEQGFLNLQNVNKTDLSDMPDMIRFDSMYLKSELCAAFDGIFILPKTTVSEAVR